MRKPWHIWLFSAFCALLVFAAMAAITRHTLKLEKANALAAANAQLDERIRLAMWRMDSQAAGIVAEENNRPAWHFSDTNEARLSPLNVALPSNVRLHFEINQGKIRTPQRNRWGTGDNSWAVQGRQLSQQVTGSWNSLNGLLLKDKTFTGWLDGRNADSEFSNDNAGLLSALARRGVHASPDKLPNLDAAGKQRLAHKGEFSNNDAHPQQVYNKAEKAQRQVIVGNALKTSPKPTKPTPDAKQPTSKSEISSATKDGVNPKQADPIVAQRMEEIFSGNGSLNAPGMYFTPMRPVWVSDELLLVREVNDGRQTRLQGVWLNAHQIKRDLLANIRDLLASADLHSVKRSPRVILGEVPDPTAENPRVMAALPWKLVPNEEVVAPSLGWTPMRKTLALAWVGVAFAAMFAMFLLRGVVKLSERRASFVSSVTHELRTPLTTFGLYSDMLAEGMVKDAEKQQQYLETLRHESTRLTHLVENVLAYSRIERGSARARHETLTLGDFLHRISSRLRERAEESNMRWEETISEETSTQSVTMDTTAVEQIIFNLVDNAAKYATEGGSSIHLTASLLKKRINIQVIDDGPGIPSRDRRRLFRAFHKSAAEAAHTQPGVGLGLALSRRLARAMGGKLSLARSRSGATFMLDLPMH